MILAHGRDPYFPGWPDTLQLNYGNPALQEAMIGEMVKIAAQCDGIRCDMAMLVLPEVFERTWGVRTQPFWSRATRQVRVRHAGFCFMAEVYWDMEWTLQQQGFDYAYDKRLYDRLREGHARPVRLHFQAGLDYQSKLARFLENHDEPRAATAFAPGMHEAAAVITYLAPGCASFIRGKSRDAGNASRRIWAGLPWNRSTRTSRNSIIGCWPGCVTRPCEPAPGSCSTAPGLGQQLDLRLLHRLRLARFHFLGCSGERLIAAVNYAPQQSQCLLRLPFAELANRQWRLEDQLGPNRYDRNGNDLAAHGLYLDLAPWQTHLFTLTERA